MKCEKIVVHLWSLKLVQTDSLEIPSSGQWPQGTREAQTSHSLDALRIAFDLATARLPQNDVGHPEILGCRDSGRDPHVGSPKGLLGDLLALGPSRKSYVFLGDPRDNLKARGPGQGS